MDAASGVMFVSLEDETGISNLVLWPKVQEQQRRALLGARLMLVEATRRVLAQGLSLLGIPRPEKM